MRCARGGEGKVINDNIYKGAKSVFLTASERYVVSRQHLSNIQLCDIQERMTDASLDGLYEIRVRYEMTKEVRDYLRELGYHITYFCSSDGESHTTIDWRR